MKLTPVKMCRATKNKENRMVVATKNWDEKLKETTIKNKDNSYGITNTEQQQQHQQQNTQYHH